MQASWSWHRKLSFLLSQISSVTQLRCNADFWTQLISVPALGSSWSRFLASSTPAWSWAPWPALHLLCPCSGGPLALSASVKKLTQPQLDFSLCHQVSMCCPAADFYCCFVCFWPHLVQDKHPSCYSMAPSCSSIFTLPFFSLSSNLLGLL